MANQAIDTRKDSAGPTLGGSLRPRGPIRFALSAHEEDGVTVLSVGGELDVLTAPKLGGCLDDIVRRSLGAVVIDLRDVAFIDSAGLQVLLSGQRRLMRQDRRLVVFCDEGAVRRVIELARLVETLGVTAGL